MDGKLNSLLIFSLLLWWYTQHSECSLQSSISNACFSDGYCGYHDLRCEKTEKIAIRSATHGFKPRSKTCPFTAGGTDCQTLNTTFCCSEEKDRDCTLSYHENDLKDVFESCSGKSFCRLQPTIVKDSCYSISQSETASFSSIEYGCIDETSIVKMCSDDVALGNELSSVFKPNGFSLLYDRGCQCRLESLTPDVEVPVYVYVMDVRFSRSTISDCYSELRLTKQRKVVGSVRSPKSKELGFLHSFIPVVNLTTPVDINLIVSKEALPEYVWLRFEAPTHQVILKCNQAEEIEVALCKKGASSVSTNGYEAAWETTPLRDTSTETPADIVDIMLATMLIVLSKKASLIAGGTAAICLLICSIILSVFYYRKKKLKTLQTIDFAPRTDMAGQPKYRMRRKCSISRLGTNGPLKLVKGIWPDESSTDIEANETPPPEQQVKRVNRKSILEIITGFRKPHQQNVQISANDFQLKQKSSPKLSVIKHTTDCETSSLSTELQNSPSRTSSIDRTSSRLQLNQETAIQNIKKNLKPVANQNNIKYLSTSDLRNNTQAVYVQCDLQNPYLSIRRGSTFPKDGPARLKERNVDVTLISEKFQEYSQTSKDSIKDACSIPETIKEEECVVEEKRFKKKRKKFQTFPRIFMRYFDSSIEEEDKSSPTSESGENNDHSIYREKGNKKRDLSNFLNMFKKTDDSTQDTDNPLDERVKPTPAKRNIKYPPKPSMSTTSSQVCLTETQFGENGDYEIESPERPPPPRPPKMPLRNPIKVVNDVYTQVVNIRKEAKLRKQANVTLPVAKEHASPRPSTSRASTATSRSRNPSMAQDSCFYRNDYMPPLRSVSRSREELTEVSGFYEPINVTAEEELESTYHRLETPRNSQFRGTKMIASFFNSVKNFKLK